LKIKYINAITPVAVKCKEEHLISINPNHLKNDQDICITCNGRGSEVAKQKYFNRIAEMGGRVIGEYTIGIYAILHCRMLIKGIICVKNVLQVNIKLKSNYSTNYINIRNM
jgi:hypothetical protein